MTAPPVTIATVVGGTVAAGLHRRLRAHEPDVALNMIKSECLLDFVEE
jgi:hypothetical protein